MGITRIRADADVPPLGLQLKLLPVSLATFAATSPPGRSSLAPTFISGWKTVCSEAASADQTSCLARELRPAAGQSAP